MKQTTEDFSASPPGTLTIIIGLSGSGKSAYIESLAKANPQLSVYDDYQGGAYGGSRDPRLSKHFGPLVNDLRQAKNVVVSDIRYCVPHELNSFLSVVLGAAPNVRIELKYFENNPEACRRNVVARNKQGTVDMELELIDRLTADYSVPTIEHLAVYDQN